MNAQIIALVNQKGGVTKTTSCVNLAAGLAQAGKKVLVVDCDPQASLTISLGNPQPDRLPVTLSDMMGKVLNDQPITPGEGILHHPEGIDLMPADIQLSGMEVSLVNAMSRETILRQYLDTVKHQYTHILLDCQPSLGMLTVNALAAANRIIIPVQAEYLPAKGLEQLLQTVARVRRQINPKLQIDGILLATRTDDEGNDYEVEVPYTYYICNVKLENFDLSHLPVYIMGEDQVSLYSMYMSSLGNRPDLFPTDQYPNASQRQDYLDYDVPPEALEDDVFAAMLTEAEKYLGMPYVWGGSSPSTSFDCSGFVSWVINHSGWNVGRLGAQGLCNICTPVSPANARPGDLVFFRYTYNAPNPDGVTHCGIYVGNNIMIHCGNPISYANLNSNYWQEHFYCYGRLP